MANDWLLVAADLAVGVAFAVLAVAAWPRSRGTAALAALVVLTWAAGTALPEAALFWHRGVLIHLLLTFPGARPGSWLTLGAVTTGYVAALAPVVWATDGVALVLAAGLAALAAMRRSGSGAPPNHSHQRMAASIGLALLSAAIAGGAAARAVVPAPDVARPTLVGYCVTLVIIAVVLAWHLRRRPPGVVADLVVELAERPSPTLARQLAVVLGDPELRVGYWDQDAGEFRDTDGRRVALPDGTDPRRDRIATVVDRGGSPFAVLMHHRTVGDDPELVESIRHATLLTAENDALRQELLASVGEVTASRRRLLVAEDDERQRLSARLAAEVAGPLAAVRERIGSVAGHAMPTGVDRVLERLESASGGLHPAELELGLAPALEALVLRSPQPVDLVVDLTGDGPGDAAVARAAYYLVAEALTNVHRHAAAGSVQVSVTARGPGNLVVRIVDDGVGGADPALGSGLSGLADRIAAVGGTFEVVSSPGEGTVVQGSWPASQPRGVT